MLQKFKEHLYTNFSFLLEAPFLVAVSGGIDSVVLTHLCKELQLNFAICHCNFTLREQESNDDERFVQQLAHQFKKECFSTSFNTQAYALTHKLSIQVAARQLRYQWFYQLLEEHPYQYVLTGHNTNDNLETFLINLTRGTGLEGFTGIPPINQKSVRPLLAFSRDTIMMYAIKNGIEWREDKSNANIKYIRNKVRHQILPVLQEINPNLLDSFQNTLHYLNESKQLIDDRIQEICEEVIEKTTSNYLIISIKKMKKLSNQKAYLYAILKQYGFTEWSDVEDLLHAQSGKQVFSKTHRLVKNRESLLLTTLKDYQQKDKIYQIKNTEKAINQPINLSFKTTQQIKPANPNEILVDKDLLKFPLRIRKWVYGDYFCPVGMKGTKKVSQLFKDRKLSLLQKENSWLLTNAENEIIWVIGMRQDRRFLISNTTQVTLKISLS